MPRYILNLDATTDNPPVVDSFVLIKTKYMLSTYKYQLETYEMRIHELLDLLDDIVNYDTIDLTKILSNFHIFEITGLGIKTEIDFEQFMEFHYGYFALEAFVT